jgi:hypothetical protein
MLTSARSWSTEKNVTAANGRANRRSAHPEARSDPRLATPTPGVPEARRSPERRSLVLVGAETVGVGNTSVWVDLGFCLSADRNALGFGNYAICPNRPVIRLLVSSIETRACPALYATPILSGEIATPTMRPGVGDGGRGFDRRIATPLRMRAPTRDLDRGRRPEVDTGGSRSSPKLASNDGGFGKTAGQPARTNIRHPQVVCGRR